MDVGGWLRNLGLGQYESAFIKNAIDTDVLPELTEGDLEKLGIPLGDRKRLIKAIKAVAGGSPSALITSEVGENAPSDAAERRHLTVMFCDLVGSAAHSDRLDPEDMWRATGSYRVCMGEIIDRHHGMIARDMSHGVLAYFGYPHAQEDDVEQAVRAALALVDAVANVRTDVDAALQARVGIATGTVVVSELLIGETRSEQEVVGQTPNLAARLQTLAEPGTVLI
ncbi:MAG: adenylate/guanylate cyclase domain-containing protein, partial [Pseudolabrys sp.]